MVEIVKLYSLDNEVFRYYMFYMSLMMLKMGAIIFVTIRRRFRNKVFANPEDTRGTVSFQNEEVERARRVHLNDMENIYVFAIVGLLYIATDPSAYLAKMLFRVFAYSRIAHTVFYLHAIPQPSRALAFTVGFLINNYMAFSILRFAA